MGGAGPIFGQCGHFYKFVGDKCDHSYLEECYRTKVRRQLGVPEKRLEGAENLVGDQYTIADIATFPWVDCGDWTCGAWEHLGVEEFPNVVAWHKRCEKKPASIRGNAFCEFD